MSDASPIRRSPPPFVRARVTAAERVGARMQRLHLAGEGLAEMAAAPPAASVRLLLPPRHGELEIPDWAGNEFLHRDGRRAAIRTLTPLSASASGDLAVDVVLHGHGQLAEWAEAAAVGEEVALSGPGRGFEVDPTADRYLLVGDEAALPAIGQLLGALPPAVPVDAVVEVRDPTARIELPTRADSRIEWLDARSDQRVGTAMVAAVQAAPMAAGTHVWAAGEAAAVQALRRHLFDERGLSRSKATIRGYWKHGRDGVGVR